MTEDKELFLRPRLEEDESPEIPMDDPDDEELSSDEEEDDEDDEDWEPEK